MNFAQPHMLWSALAGLAGLAFFLVWAWRTKQRLLTQFVPARLLDTLIANVSRERQKAKLIVLFLAVGCVALALARPQWGMAWEESKQRGLDIVVAIDTSRSMLANDIAPNRLARAKLAALDLMRVAKSDRLGLVAFAGTAFLQCPLTLDEEAFRQSVDSLDTTIIPQGGSSMAEAINIALTAFAKEEDSHKVLVMFTDGEDHEEGAVEAAKEAAKAGMHIFTIGLGTPEGELLRLTDENGQTSFLKDEDGNAVKSRLNETLLRQIAGATDKGFYLPLRGASVVEMLYKDGIEQFPKQERSSKFMQRFQDRFQWPLALGILLLTVEMFISERKRLPAGRAITPTPAVAKAAVAVVMLGMGLLAAVASPNSARHDFQEGRFKEAQEEYARLAAEKPGDPRLSYNAGAAAYRAGEYDGATEQFTAALRAQDVNLQQQAYYNLGNTLFRAGESQSELQEKINAWEQSVKHFDAAMKLKPEDADAKFNRDVISKKLEELKKQQQQQQKPDQQNKDDQKDKQDQKDQSQKQDGNKKDSQQQQPKPKDQSDPKQKEDSKGDQQSKEKKAGGKDDDQKKKGQKKNQNADQKGAKPETGDEAQAQMGGAIGQMNMQQAMQLLDAQKGDVKALIFRPPESDKPRPRNYKNW